MNPVIAAIDAGHLHADPLPTGKKGKPPESDDPGTCRKCMEPWPCLVIKQARAKVREGDRSRAREVLTRTALPGS